MAQDNMSGKVLTVLGPIEPEELGITITHEHLLLDVTCYVRQAEEASNRVYRHAPVTMESLAHLPELFAHSLENLSLFDEKAALEEVSLYKYAGGNSLVDTTSISIARDPLALARISRATGLNIVMGGSYYVPISHPQDMDERSEDSIAEEIIRDITVGVGDTGIRSGIIGEIGNTSPLGDNERKVLRASGRAQAETGAPITIHPGPDPDAKAEIIEVLTSAGADPHRVIMGHLDSFAFHEREAVKSLAETGCFLEVDVIGWEDSSVTSKLMPRLKSVNDVQRLEGLEFLVEQGYLDRILIAQDVCQKWMTTRYGGKGYAHILNNILPRMRKRGWTEDQIHTILVENPKRALAFR